MKQQRTVILFYTIQEAKRYVASLLEASVAIEQIKTNKKGAFRKKLWRGY